MTISQQPFFSTRLLLCILDGWGIAQVQDFNALDALARAKTPIWDDLLKNYPHTLLEASGRGVGLPEGQMGNSEVGHMNIGAGRVVEQILPKLDRILPDFTARPPPLWQQILATLNRSGGTLHLLGVLSNGRVHGCIDHVIAMAKSAIKAGIPLKIHGMGDGRDCPPQALPRFLDLLGRELGTQVLTTLVGRYYGMDRDKRWERTRSAWELWQQGLGQYTDNLSACLERHYAQGLSDEMLPPIHLEQEYQGFAENDILVCTNFRIDRMKQIAACSATDFNAFPRSGKFPSAIYSMVPYGEEFSHITPLFARNNIVHPLGEIIAQAGATQLRLAETEKFPHVTYFMNGGREDSFRGEQRILIPSPKVASYDQAPRMSAEAITDALLETLRHQDHALSIVNFANPDMVGHTGNFAAVCQAIECVDQQLARIIPAARALGITVMVTADHGNAEVMWDEVNQQPHTAHTTNPVAFVLCDFADNAATLAHERRLEDSPAGKLGDIAPTILERLGLDIPAEMTGTSLLRRP